MEPIALSSFLVEREPMVPGPAPCEVPPEPADRPGP